MIIPANTRLISEIYTNLPQMANVIKGWFQKMTFTLIVKTLSDGELVETETNIEFQGVKQPMSAEKLDIKSEGQRDWDWFTIHSDFSLILEVDDIIKQEGIIYRVLDKSSYKEYGYMEYDIVRGYQN